ncbi:hypothetical protein MC885_018637 [Smutsia gigantea]|nr:hypothetical protein MC885_018637 [Smutsia gigantea]
MPTDLVAQQPTELGCPEDSRTEVDPTFQILLFEMLHGSQLVKQQSPGVWAAEGIAWLSQDEDCHPKA